MEQPLICETVSATRLADLRRRRDAASAADLVELRLDGLRDLDVAGALEGRRRPVVVTCRPSWEGGRFDGSEDERLRILAAAYGLGAEYVDVEWRADRAAFATLDSRRLVLSRHEFDGTPGDADLQTWLRTIRQHHPGVVKLAVTAHSAADCLRLREIVARDEMHVAVAMGTHGLISRVCPSLFGSRWTYTGSAAPGQVSTAVLAGEFRVRAVGERTAVHAVTDGTSASWVTTAVLNAGFADVGFDAVAVPLATGDVDELLAAVRVFGLAGASLAAPLTTTLVPHLASASPSVARLHAADSIAASPAGLSGENFDLTSFLAPLDRRSVRLRGATAIVLGAGQAARVAALALKGHGASVVICGRRLERAEALGAALGVPVAPWPPSIGADLLVNATPIGGSGTDADAEAIVPAVDRAAMVYDLVCGPDATAIERRAHARGIPVIGGLERLAARARRQVHWWTGRDASIAAFERAAFNAWASPPTPSPTTAS